MSWQFGNSEYTVNCFESLNNAACALWESYKVITRNWDHSYHISERSGCSGFLHKGPTSCISTKSVWLMCAQSWQHGKYIWCDVLSRFIELAGAQTMHLLYPFSFFKPISKEICFVNMTTKHWNCFKNSLFCPECYRASASKPGLTGGIRPAEILGKFSYNF
jgi:hypothetical protein